MSKNKRYEIYNLTEDVSIFRGYYVNYSVDVSLLKRLSKSLGFSYDLYLTMLKASELSADLLVKSMSSQSNIEKVVLLLDDEDMVVVDYSIDSERYPILNDEFIARVRSLAETSRDISISEVYYHDKDTISSVILKKNDPIVVEEKYIDKASKYIDYSVGILLVNDETNSVYSRLVIYVEGQPLYLPASYYNATNTRYRRSTSSSVEALEILVLKVIEDLRDENLKDRIYDIHYKYRSNKEIAASYEEYTSVLRTMRKVPTIIEESSYLESLLEKYEAFERKYSHLEEKKSSYVWRCTAISDLSVGSLISITSRILTDLGAPPIEYMNIRDLLGTYLSTDRIVEEIAREDMK